MSAAFLKERIGAVKVISITVSIVGVVLVTQPDFLFNTAPEHDFTNSTYIIKQEFTVPDDNSTQQSGDISKNYLGYILIVTYGLSSASSLLLVRAISNSYEVATDIQVTWMHLMGLTISAILMGIFEKPKLPRNIMESLYLSGHIIFSFIGTFSYHLAFQLTSGVLVVLANTPAIVFTVLIQYYVTYNIRPGHRNVLEVCGSILIFIAAGMNPVYQIITNRKNKHEHKDESTEENELENIPSDDEKLDREGTSLCCDSICTLSK